MANFYAFYPPSGGGSSANPSVGTNGATAPTSSTEVAGINPSGNLQPLQTDSSGNLLVSVNASGVTSNVNLQQVGGSAIALGNTTTANSLPVTIASDQAAIPVTATLSGTSTVRIQDSTGAALNSNGSGALKVDGSAVTQPVSAASLPLPTGAATSALQSSVQGATSGGTAAASSLLNGGIYNSTALTLTNGQQASLQLDAAGNLKTSGTAVVSGTVAVSSLPSIPAGSNTIGAISNTSFAATQSTASALNATIVGLGTAGTPAGGVVSVQGVSGGQPLPVSGSITAINTSNGNTNAAVPAQATQVGGSDGTNLQALSVNSAGQLNVNNISGTISLPTGAATSANQTNIQSAPGTSASTAITIQGSASGVAIPISGTVTATVSGVATAANQTNGTQQTQLVQGGNTATILSSGQLTTLTPDTTTTGSITSTQSVTAAVNGLSSAGISVAGTWTGTLVIEGSSDGGASYYPLSAATLSTGLIATSFSANNAFQANVSGLSNIRVRGNTVTSGTANVTIRLNATAGAVVLSEPLPQGGNTIGSVGITGTVPLPTGASTSALQSSIQGAISGGTAAINSALIGGTYNSGALTLTNGQQAALQLDASGNLKVAGAVTASNPSVSLTGTAIPTSATLVGGSDGTNLRALSTNASGQLNVNNISGTVSLPTGASTAANQTAPLGSVAPGTVATNSMLQGIVYNSTPPTVTTGQQVAMQSDSTGNLKVTVVSGTITASNPSVGTTGTTAPTSATEIGVINGSGNLVGITQGPATSANSLPVVIATDQGAFSVGTAPLAVYGTPTSVSMAALNATVQYNVDPSANIYISLTNPPAATTAWSGTVSFEYSINNGSSWNALTVFPAGGPTSGGGVTSTTANGFWFADAPAETGLTGNYVLIRARMSAYTSGTAYFFISAQSQANAAISLPWTYSVTSGNTVVGPLDVSGISEINVDMTAITTAVYTWQGTNDPSLTSWKPIDVQDTGAQTTGSATIAAVPTGAWRMVPSGYRWVRLQCTTTGTVWTVQGVSAKLGQVNVLSAFGNSVSAQVVAGTLTTVATVTSVTTTATNNTTYSAVDQASAAIVTTTTSATKTIPAGTALSMMINMTAVSGTTPTYDFQIQESVDATSWTTIYQAPRFTGTGFFQTPAIRINALNYRYVETISGTTPSFTRILTSNRIAESTQLYRNLIDRSITTTLTNSTTGTLFCEGATAYTIIVNQGAGGSAVQFALDGSDDNLNWVQGLTNCFGVTGGSTPVSMSYSGTQFRYIRVRAVTGVASSTISYITLIATDSASETLKPQSSGLVDGSGTTSATPSTSTQAIAAFANRRYLLIQNVSTTATLWVNFSSAATTTQPSIELLPGGSLVQESSFVSPEAINVISTSASVPYMIKSA